MTSRVSNRVYLDEESRSFAAPLLARETGGLIVTVAIERPGYRVTHVATGFQLDGLIFRTERAASSARVALLDLGDWIRVKPAKVTRQSAVRLARYRRWKRDGVLVKQ